MKTWEMFESGGEAPGGEELRRSERFAVSVIDLEGAEIEVDVEVGEKF